MKLKSFEELNSTHKYLIENIKNSSLKPPIAIITNRQTNGEGSRGNSWESLDGNLFLSFALQKKDLPKDLPLTSLSIYFTYILKITLADFGSQVWVKWPNDLYIKNSKIGGAISLMHKEIIIYSIGLNTTQKPKNFGILDIKIEKEKLLNKFFKKIKQKPSWKQIFNYFNKEFHNSKNFTFNLKKDKISLQNAILLKDGSISINNKKIYNIR